MHEPSTQQPAPLPKQPLSGAKHFWLSFLAVITGIPVAGMIVSVGFLLLVFIFAVLIAAASPSGSNSSQVLSMSTIYGSDSASNTVAVVPVQGTILSGSAADPLSSLFGASFADGEKIKEQLRALADDDSVKGVILEIDSPGGMITASKAIADGVAFYRATTKRPIVAHINGLGASGAYWAAASTDAIYAEQGSEVGSIGVIFGPLVTYKGIISDGAITTNEPITYRYFSAGRSKDLGSPYRDITPEEEAFLNGEIQDEYERFVTFVSERRSISPETIKTDIGALAYGTTGALRKDLMDQEMSKEQVFTEVASKAGLKSYNVKRVDANGSIIGSIFGASGLLRGRMSSSERSAGRLRFCTTNLINKPLVMSGDVSAICK